MRMGQKSRFQEKIDLLSQIRKSSSFSDIHLITAGLSYYLAELNSAFHYNESYLIDASKKFEVFINAMGNKEDVAETIFQIIIEELGPLNSFNLEASLVVDDIWQMDLVKQELKVAKQGSLDHLLDENVFIHVKVSRDAQEFEDFSSFPLKCAQDCIDRVVEAILAKISHMVDRKEDKLDDRQYQAV